MDPGTGTGTKPNKPPRRALLGSQGHFNAPRSRSDSLSPDDGFNYHDKEPSPEDEPTRERRGAKDLPIDPIVNSAGVNAQEEDVYHVWDNWKPNIYERDAGGRRAKMPDEENQVNDAVHADDEPVSPEKAKLRHVMLKWEKEVVDGAQMLVLNARVPAVSSKKSESPIHVVWQHSGLEDMTFERLESLVTQVKSQGLQQSEIGLTRRLLKRVRKKAQRAFVGGSFLAPLALRYDILDRSKYSVDKCCIFLAFPYFAVDKVQPRKLFDKGSGEHPTRTLLQSCYRLNDTAERDTFHCIKLLQRKTLRSCINASDEDLAQLSPNVKDELVYVPQLWALILGLDKMITTGPISDSALQGKSFKVQDQATSHRT